MPFLAKLWKQFFQENHLARGIDQSIKLSHRFSHGSLAGEYIFFKAITEILYFKHTTLKKQSLH